MGIDMKIMAMADVESTYIWDHYQKGMFDGIDLILSAGDLNPRYLTFIETLSNVPLLYVHGNHDEKYRYDKPEGCICIDDDLYIHNGIRILGLGGCMRYRPGAHQYTEGEMRRRILRMTLKLKRYGGFDILLPHAPLAGFHDAEDPCHRGFEAYRKLLEQYHPEYFIHGHIHMDYGLNSPRLACYKETVVINAFRTYTFNYGDPAVRTEAERHPDNVPKTS